MATYVIGDVQGCVNALLCLLEKIQFNPQKDQLILAGDLVNRGPSSLETLRILIRLGKAVRCVLGNHDLHLLAVAHNARHTHSHDTLDDILTAPDKIELLEWLIHQPLLIHLKEFKATIVHAGLAHHWSLPQAMALSDEVSQCLKSSQAFDFLTAMYGSEPCGWSDDLSGFDRLRVITNYLTRVRIVNSKGEMQLLYKGDLEHIPQGYMPWFAHPHRHYIQHTRVVFGHWAALLGDTHQSDSIALDTGCVWGKRLTALCLDNQKIFSCSCA